MTTITQKLSRLAIGPAVLAASFTACTPTGGGGTDPTGACCSVDGSCSVTTNANCSGAYQGDATTCDAADCADPTGACCLNDGTCDVTTEMQCSGQYLGDDATCEAADCAPPTGACCDATGACTPATRDDCDGAFQGAGTMCEADSCSASPFADEAAQRGVTYLVVFGQGDEAGTGIGFIDFDEDGDPDLMIMGKPGAGDLGLYENDGTGHFIDRSDGSGLAPAPQARGIAAADYDADGDVDVYLSYWLEPNVLYRNDGNFQFTDVTATAGVADDGTGTGCAWGDYDGDGRLDLYSSNYEPEHPNHLYRNNGDGTFTDVGAALGVDSTLRTYQAVFVDYDGDADVDLYTANDLQASVCPECCNELYENNNGVFSVLSADTGANACVNSMSTAVGDINNDLALDLHFTDDANAPGNILLLNRGDGTFDDASDEAGINPLGSIGWGSVMFDYDNDGYEELFVLNNNTPNRFYENDGSFPLTNVATELGMDDGGASYCVAVADIDNDGDLDVALQNRQATLRILINHEGHKRRWVKFRVIGEGHNTNGIGATVTISAGGKSQIRHLMAGHNYKSQNERLLHFGLDEARTLDTVTIVWPGGNQRTLSGYAGNETWTLYPTVRLGDADGDGDVDATDRAVFESCRGTVRPGCEMMDLDGDADVDDADEAAL